MNSAIQHRIERLNKEIANLQLAMAREKSKIVKIQLSITRLKESIARSRNKVQIQSKLREIDRENKKLASVQKKINGISIKISNKSKMLYSCQERQIREEKQIFTNAVRQAQKLRLPDQHKPDRTLQNVDSLVSDSAMNSSYDFFIAHASEDKDDFVRDLANTLTELGAEVWYDEFTLMIGQSLRREIDRGLSNSRYGIVILSKHFFRKEWPQKELDGLLTLESDTNNRILPIWYRISKDEVSEYSPTLADRIALKAPATSTAEIAGKLIERIKLNNS